MMHQGENNRDDVVLHGNRTNADFFVNGIRDDAQVFRDVYNLDRVEVLKGPAGVISDAVARVASSIASRSVRVSMRLEKPH